MPEIERPKTAAQLQQEVEATKKALEDKKKALASATKSMPIIKKRAGELVMEEYWQAPQEVKDWIGSVLHKLIEPRKAGKEMKPASEASQKLYARLIDGLKSIEAFEKAKADEKAKRAAEKSVPSA